MNLPLYADARDQPIQPQGHLGLYWERFFDGYPEQWNPEVDNKAKEAWANNKVKWLEKFDQSCGDSRACEAACLRQRGLAQALNGECRTYKVEWRFVTGTGLPHPMENGFLWHPSLGVPYLSGSAVKGLVRSWIEAWNPFNESADQCLERLYRWFGSEDKDPVTRKSLRANGFNPPTNTAQPGLDTEAGGFIFFDALPAKPVRLKADVMTPHMGKWYEKGSEELDKPENQPADWHDPTPIGFLTAENPIFQFAVAPRNERASNELEPLISSLDEALTWLGVGAKTAVGYGHMSKDEQTDKDLREQEAQARIEKEKALRQERERARMTPAKREIGDLTEGQNNPNVVIFQAIEQDRVNSQNRLEIIQLLKEQMITDKIWKLEGKPPKVVKRCKQIQKWLDES